MYKLAPMYTPFGSDTPKQRLIIRLADMAYIPVSNDIPEYQEYLRWLDLGNTPEPADNPPQGETP
jgi:hypothetical protein